MAVRNKGSPITEYLWDGIISSLHFSFLPTVFLATYTSLTHTPAHISTASQLPPPSISSILTCVTLHLLPWWSLRSMRLWCWCRLPARVIASPGIRDYFYRWALKHKAGCSWVFMGSAAGASCQKESFSCAHLCKPTCHSPTEVTHPGHAGEPWLRDFHTLLHIRCNYTDLFSGAMLCPKETFFHSPA